MYGRQGILVAQPGQRVRLVEILMRAAELVGQLPGCRQYLVAEGLDNDTDVFVFEAWDSPEAHSASLQLETVRALIAEALPLLGRPPQGGAVRILGGHGLFSTDH
jgi:quinol monooxygenase YgiN